MSYKILHVKSTKDEIDEFAKDVDMGLSANPKYLKSKYFYDAKGVKIYENIMNMPEYYLIASEYQANGRLSAGITDFISGSRINIAEFGPGNGEKTLLFMQNCIQHNLTIKYIPIDISKESITYITDVFTKKLPQISIKGIVGDYTHGIDELTNLEPDNPKIILFMGSNIGNFSNEEEIEFISNIAEKMNEHDSLIISFDLVKDIDTMFNAYNDPYGHTSRFNLNLLDRINTTLGGDINLSNFHHEEPFNQETSCMESYLVSNVDQTIHLNSLDKEFHISSGEKISTEISRKYTLDYIDNLAVEAKIKVVKQYFDDSEGYAICVFKIN
ncbi:MAG: L-histidine N(alpha)-methyltransferase [Candidatus Heimdallarchaeota archaeon]|nr:L-histidine N(alpha)-methyltransferase [Candidatus Heimdallarchaeota archaeon]MDH5644969.1 L-histidine N(alpha)-methyltransferase [Candidatus Heimdallarchaeota archaeon]